MSKIKTLNCDQCSCEFEVSNRSWIDRRKAKRLENVRIFCSKECRMLGRSQLEPLEVSCIQCDKLFIRHQSELKKSNNHFCSHSCSAIYNNPITPKKSKTKVCKTCNNLIYNNVKFCETCISIGKHLRNAEFMITRTLGDELKNGRKDANRYNNIRSHARKVVKHLPQVCDKCGYIKHVQVCHRKAIKDFSMDSLIGEINSLNNLMLLCPNCHWEFDHKI